MTNKPAQTAEPSLVERLRKLGKSIAPSEQHKSLIKAADRITELEAQLAEWKSACEAKTEIMRGHTEERQDLQRQVLGLQSDNARLEAQLAAVTTPQAEGMDTARVSFLRALFFITDPMMVEIDKQIASLAAAPNQGEK